MDGFEALLPIVLLLCTGFIIILVSRVLRISPVVGFLLAGIGLGPHGIGLITSSDTTALLAKMGVVFLLFDIGLHFSFKTLWAERRDLFGIAPFQVFFSGLLIGGSLSFFIGLSAEMAVLIGLALALSSTAVVMQMLSDSGQASSPVGQSGKLVLIFQDLVAVFLLIYADTIGTNTALLSTVMSTLLKTIASIAAVVALGRFVLAPLMKMIIRYDDPEMFTILGLLIVMVTGLATAEAGLSLTLGAFLAGMVLAGTPFKVLLQTELRPFRGLLMAFFFITVGMILDPAAVMKEPGAILGIVALIVLIKVAVMMAVMAAFRRRPHHMVQLSLLLAQGSEFALVVFSMQNVQAFMGMSLVQQMVAAVTLSMMVAPFLNMLGTYLSIKICNKLEDTICNCPGGEESPVGRQPVFILGMNEVGRTLARGLQAHNIPYIAVEYDRKRFLDAIASGFIVAYGEPRDLRFWNTMGVSKARALAVASPRYEVAKAVTPLVKRLYPDLKRYVSVQDSAEGVRFAGLGLKPFHGQGIPPGLEMACFILRDFDIAEEQVNFWVEEEQAASLSSGHTNKLQVFDESVAA